MNAQNFSHCIYGNDDCKKCSPRSKALKKYCMPLKEAIEEHKRIVPELRKAGLKKEAKTQGRELSKLENK
jgi:hypothetical protein